MYVFGSGRRGWRGCEWMRGLGCFACGGMDGEWVRAWTRVLMGGWCYDCMRCESGLSVYMAGPVICVLCLADTCASKVHPVFDLVAPYEYLLSIVYLFMEDIANPDLFVCGCRTWISLDIARFYEA